MPLASIRHRTGGGDRCHKAQQLIILHLFTILARKYYSIRTPMDSPPLPSYECDNNVKLNILKYAT